MKAYSNDLRARAVRAIEAGGPARSIAQRLGVSEKWVYKIAKQCRDTVDHEMRQSPGRPRRSTCEDLERLRDLVRGSPDATFRELKERGGFAVGISSLARYQQEMGMTFKKTVFRHRAEVGRCGRRSKRYSEG